MAQHATWQENRKRYNVPIVHFQITKSMYVDKTTVTRKNGEKYTQYLLRTSKRQGNVWRKPVPKGQNVYNRRCQPPDSALSLTLFSPNGLVVLHMFCNQPMFADYSWKQFSLLCAICLFCTLFKASCLSHFAQFSWFNVLLSGVSTCLISSVNMRGYFGKMGKKTCVKRQAQRGVTPIALWRPVGALESERCLYPPVTMSLAGAAVIDIAPHSGRSFDTHKRKTLPMRLLGRAGKQLSRSSERGSAWNIQFVPVLNIYEMLASIGIDLF